MRRPIAVASAAASLLFLALPASPLAPPSPLARAGRPTSSTALRSVPNSIDTFTSGLASIARLPRGVTVSGGKSSVGPGAAYLPTIKELYDIENDRDCRAVRERITELDLVVGRVTCVAPGSRAAREDDGIVAPTLVADVGVKEVKLFGVDQIMDFFDEYFSTEKLAKKEAPKAAEDEDGITLGQVIDKALDLISFLPGLLRGGRGTKVCSAASHTLNPRRPEKPLVLYSYEGNQFCRLVREVLTELDLPYELRSAGKESPRREELADLTGGSSQCPYLIDPNADASMPESRDIVEYLYSTYAAWAPPNELLRATSDITTMLNDNPVFSLGPLYKRIAPLQAGKGRGDDLEYVADVAEAKAEIYDEISSKPVVIYTYELSPYCTEAMAVLKSIGIDFKEVSLGKEWFPGLNTAPAKRAALLEITGQSSLPHVFVGGTSVGGLFSGTPGLVPSLERGEFKKMIDETRRSFAWSEVV